MGGSSNRVQIDVRGGGGPWADLPSLDTRSDHDAHPRLTPVSLKPYTLHAHSVIHQLNGVSLVPQFRKIDFIGIIISR